MGRIKTSYIKHIGYELFEKNFEKFTTDFSKNKKMVKELISFKSKRMLNIVTGYITSLKKRSKK